ncbi:hypothetical protein C0584_03015 [Candidatus Parcubacteria bacterium]|nr:MAG: hypothetical protein C0584_03015 [Candidatus Parcubacteria bacterium]
MKKKNEKNYTDRLMDWQKSQYTFPVGKPPAYSSEKKSNKKSFSKFEIIGVILFVLITTIFLIAAL